MSRSLPAKTPTCAAASRLFKQLQNDPLYQRSQMWALMVAMRAAGRDDADYATLMAVSGWSGQFVYNAKPDWPTFIEPTETVPRACAAMGVSLEQTRPASADEAFDFILANCTEDRPVVAEHLEFGLFVGAEDGAEPRVRFFVVPFFNDGVWWSRRRRRWQRSRPTEPDRRRRAVKQGRVQSSLPDAAVSLSKPGVRVGLQWAAISRNRSPHPASKCVGRRLRCGRRVSSWRCGSLPAPAGAAVLPAGR